MDGQDWNVLTVSHRQIKTLRPHHYLTDIEHTYFTNDV